MLKLIPFQIINSPIGTQMTPSSANRCPAFRRGTKEIPLTALTPGLWTRSGVQTQKQKWKCQYRSRRRRRRSKSKSNSSNSKRSQLNNWKGISTVIDSNSNKTNSIDIISIIMLVIIIGTSYMTVNIKGGYRVLFYGPHSYLFLINN